MRDRLRIEEKRSLTLATLLRSLFIFAWTAPFKHITWVAPCIAELLFGLSMEIIYTAFIPCAFSAQIVWL